MKSEEASLYKPRFPNQWGKIYLYDLAEWVNGLAFKPADFYSSGLPVIKIAEIKSGITNQTKYSNKNIDKRYLINSGDMLFSWSGQPETSIDTFIWQGMQGWLNQHIFKVLPNHEKLSFDYLYLLLKYLKPNFIKIASNKQTTGLGHITKADLLKIEVAIPDKNIQNQIISAIKPINDRITLLRETNATLEAIAQALFKSWFVDFDPVRAKAEGREPEGMPAEVADLFPSEFEETELGEMPKGWEIRSFDDITDVFGGGTPDTKEQRYWDNGTHMWATPKDLSGMDTTVLLETGRKISDAGLAKISSGLLQRGTVLMSSRAPIGYLAIAEIPVAINQGFIAMKPKHGISNLFILNLLHTKMDTIKSHANGSTFMEISKSAFRPIKIKVPPLEIINRFDEVAKSLYERLVENQKQIGTLTELRDTLLPRLMSGKLRIPDLEEQAA
jgi:type I restriction enzyme S subunit